MFRRYFAALAAAACWAVAAAPAQAAIQTYYFTGSITAGTSFLPGGTNFSGNFSYDDAAVDSNVSPNAGSYTGGSFEIALQGFGALTATAANVGVSNDIELFFPGNFNDFFNLTAATFNSTIAGIPNTVNSAGISFSDSAFNSNPTAVTSDSLAAVDPLSSDWERAISFNFASSGGNCGPFVSTCSATGAINSISDTAPIPEPSTWLLLTTGLGALLYSRRRRKA